MVIDLARRLSDLSPALAQVGDEYLNVEILARWYVSTGPAVLRLEGLAATGAQYRGQLQHRTGHPDPATTAIRAGQRVAGPARPAWVGLLSATPQHERRRPANRLHVGNIQAELGGQVA